MTEPLRCPRGHHWDWDDEPVTADTVCPVCGETYLDELAHTVRQTVPSVAAMQLDAKIPGYEFHTKLGAGGMGVVYRARQIRTDRLVALKLPFVREGDFEPQMRFRDEAKAVARLQHPGIVQVFEVGEHAKQPFMALEYCSGGSLSGCLDGTPLAPRVAAEIAAAIAVAVGHAHKAGVIHRDLKPGNILLAPAEPGLPPPLKGWTTKVADFGLARRLDQDLRQTQTGTILGTPYYMSPEQARGEVRVVGAAADVYSLGAMLYEMLTGRPPFKAATMLETLEQVCSQEPLPPSRLQPAIPKDLETIVLACLRKEPAKRYANGDALADDLQRFLNGQAVTARPVGAFERLLKRARRNPLTTALLSLLALSLLGGIGFGIWKQVRLTAERDRARSHFQMSMRAIDELLTEVAEQDLATEPRAEQTRQALLEKAQRFYAELLDVEAGDPAVAWEAARAAKRVGDIQRLLGRYPEAIAAYDQALQRFAKLRETGPVTDQNWHETANSHNWRGEAHRLLDHFDEADADYAGAAKLLTQHLPGESLDFAQSTYNRGVVAAAQSHFTDAERHFQTARRALAGSTSPQAKQHLARIAINRADLLRKQNQISEAIREAGDAVRTLDELIAAFPNRLIYHYERAAAANNLVLVLSADQPEKALAIAQTNYANLEPLVNQYPSTALLLVELARVERTLATFVYQLNKAKAIAYTDASIQHWERLLAIRPTPEYHGELGIVLGNRGTLGKDTPQARGYFERGILQLLIGLRGNLNDPDYRLSLKRQTKALANILKADQPAVIAFSKRIQEVLPEKPHGTLWAVCLLAHAANASNSHDAMLQHARHLVQNAKGLHGLVTPPERDALTAYPDLLKAFEP